MTHFKAFDLSEVAYSNGKIKATTYGDFNFCNGARGEDAVTIEQGKKVTCPICLARMASYQKDAEKSAYQNAAEDWAIEA